MKRTIQELRNVMGWKPQGSKRDTYIAYNEQVATVDGGEKTVTKYKLANTFDLNAAHDRGLFKNSTHHNPLHHRPKMKPIAMKHLIYLLMGAPFLMFSIALLFGVFLFMGVADEPNSSTTSHGANSQTVHQNTTTVTGNQVQNTMPSHHGGGIITTDHVLYLMGGLLLLFTIFTVGKICLSWANGKSDLIRERNQQKLMEARRAQELEKHLSNEWEKLTQRHKNVLDKWSSYDSDMEKLLTLPAMRDFTIPEIGEVIDALDQAEISKTLQHPRGIQSVNETVYYSNVIDCEKAFNNALNAARSHRDHIMSAHERKQLGLAQQLLRTAMNESASVSERQLAYSRVTAIMDELSIKVPEKMMEAIERSNRKMIGA